MCTTKLNTPLVDITPSFLLWNLTLEVFFYEVGEMKPVICHMMMSPPMSGAHSCF